MNGKFFFKIISCFIIVLNFDVVAQEIKIGSFHSIEFKKTEVDQKECTLYITAIITANGKDSLDINAFSLLDTVKKKDIECVALKQPKALRMLVLDTWMSHI